MKKSRAEIAIRNEIEKTKAEIADIEKQIDALRLELTVDSGACGQRWFT